MQITKAPLENFHSSTFFLISAGSFVFALLDEIMGLALLKDKNSMAYFNCMLAGTPSLFQEMSVLSASSSSSSDNCSRIFVNARW